MVEKPIIIFGTGRSGTTVVHRILAEHESLAWISEACNRPPFSPQSNQAVMNAFDANPEQKARPVEGYELWESLCIGFRTPFRDLREDDLTVRKRDAVRSAFSKLTTDQRSRLLLKVTGWPRLGFLKALFPDAKFIHIVRDGRAVANSLINVEFWRGWGGPEKWRWGPLSEKYDQQWQAHNQSFIVLAALQWKILMDSVQSSKPILGAENLLEVRYEDICEDPEENISNICEFADIRFSNSFANRFSSYKLKSENNKYRQELTSAQQASLNQVLSEHLKMYGYE